MQQHDDTETVKDLLALLCSRNSNLSWKMRSIFTDNNNINYMEVKIHEAHQYNNGSLSQICRLAYKPSSGLVSQMQYRGNFYNKPGTVIDTLLDIINAESRVLVN